MTMARLMAAATLAALAVLPVPAMTATPVHDHLAAVMGAAPDTPGNRGYLDVARGEAAIAIGRLEEALQRSTLTEVQAGVRAALHAVAPDHAAEGPGLGFGLLAAVDGAAERIAQAARDPAATEPVAGASMPALAAAQTMRQRLRDAVVLAEHAIAADNLFTAKRLARAMRREVQAAVAGEDLDGNGEIVWEQGEAGLPQLLAQSDVMVSALDVN